MKGAYILIGGTIHEGHDLEKLKDLIDCVSLSATWGDSPINGEDMIYPSSIIEMVDKDGYLFLCDDEDTGDVLNLSDGLQNLNIPFVTHEMDGPFSIFIPDIYGKKPIEVYADEEKKIYIPEKEIKKIIRRYRAKKKEDRGNVLIDLQNLLVDWKKLPGFELVELETNMDVHVIGGIDPDYMVDFQGRIESIEHEDGYAIIIDQDDDTHDVNLGAIKQL